MYYRRRHQTDDDGDGTDLMADVCKCIAELVAREHLTYLRLGARITATVLAAIIVSAVVVLVAEKKVPPSGHPQALDSVASAAYHKLGRTSSEPAQDLVVGMVPFESGRLAAFFGWPITPWLCTATPDIKAIDLFSTARRASSQPTPKPETAMAVVPAPDAAESCEHSTTVCVARFFQYGTDALVDSICSAHSFLFGEPA